METVRFGVASDAVRHDREILDNLWIEVSSVFNRAYTALDEIEKTTKTKSIDQPRQRERLRATGMGIEIMPALDFGDRLGI